MKKVIIILFLFSLISLSETITQIIEEKDFKQEIILVDGIREGKTTIYYENGDIEIANYKKGILNGKSTLLKAKNGSKEIRTYINGVLQGKVIRYLKDGTIVEDEYVDGILQENSNVHLETTIWRQF